MYLVEWGLGPRMRCQFCLGARTETRRQNAVSVSFRTRSRTMHREGCTHMRCAISPSCTYQLAPRPPMALSSSGQAPQARGLQGPWQPAGGARTFVLPLEHPETGWPGVTRVFAGSCGRRGGWLRALDQWGTGGSAHIQTHIYIPVGTCSP
jgi:hypothetical protein